MNISNSSLVLDRVVERLEKSGMEVTYHPLDLAGSDAMAADAPPTPPLYLHLPDGSRRSGSWSMPTTNYSYTLSYSLNVV